MRSAAMPKLTPTAAQLDEMVRRKDRISADLRGDLHEAWALSWLAMQAFESSQTGYSTDKHQEATFIALGCIVSKLEEAKSRHDCEYTGVFRAVMDKPEDVT